MLTFKQVDREFNLAMMELYRESPKSAYDIVTDQARRVLRKLAFFTRRSEEMDPSARKQRGRARAGWWQAWQRLGMSGTPYVGNAEVLGRAEGDYVDRRHAFDESSFTMINEVPYIDALDEKDNIEIRALAGQISAMARFTDRLFARNMKRKSA